MTPNELRGLVSQATEVLRTNGQIGPIPTRNGPITVGIEDLAAYRADLMPELVASLLALSTGHTATVAVAYRKQTKAPPRIEGRDYDALPGVSHEALMGGLSVFRRKDGALRLTVLTAFRSQDGQPGFATMIPEGLTDLRLQATAAPTAIPAGGTP
jgi:hypothetical protein